MGLVILGRRERQVHDREQRKHERLHGADEKVEELHEKRNDRHREREAHRTDHHLRDDDRRDDDEEQLADPNIEEESCRKRRRPREVFENIYWREPPHRLGDVRQMLEPVLPYAHRPRKEEDDERERDRRVDVAGRRTAERQSEHLEREHPELIQQEDEDKERDEERNERFAFFTKRALCQVRDVGDDAFEDGLAFADVGRSVARANPREKCQRDDHDEPGRHDRIRMDVADHRPVPGEMLADPLVHVCVYSRLYARCTIVRYNASGRKKPAKYHPIDHHGPTAANATGTIPKTRIRGKLLKPKPPTERRSIIRSPARITSRLLATPQTPPTTSASAGTVSQRMQTIPSDATKASDRNETDRLSA